MATPTMTMATMPHQQTSATTKLNTAVTGHDTPSLTSHHSSARRGSLKTGSVRHMIKNLASLSTGTSGFENNSHTHYSTANTANNDKNNEDLSPVRKHIIEEVNDDSVYSIQLKKITYSCASSINGRTGNSNFVTKCDQIDHRSGTLQRPGSHRNAQQQSHDDNQQVSFLPPNNLLFYFFLPLSLSSSFPLSNFFIFQSSLFLFSIFLLSHFHFFLLSFFEKKIFFFSVFLISFSWVFFLCFSLNFLFFSSLSRLLYDSSLLKSRLVFSSTQLLKSFRKASFVSCEKKKEREDERGSVKKYTGKTKRQSSNTLRLILEQFFF